MTIDYLLAYINPEVHIVIFDGAGKRIFDCHSDSEYWDASIINSEIVEINTLNNGVLAITIDY